MDPPLASDWKFLVSMGHQKFHPEPVDHPAQTDDAQRESVENAKESTSKVVMMGTCE